MRDFLVFCSWFVGILVLIICGAVILPLVLIAFFAMWLIIKIVESILNIKEAIRAKKDYSRPRYRSIAFNKKTMKLEETVGEPELPFEN